MKCAALALQDGAQRTVLFSRTFVERQYVNPGCDYLIDSDDQVITACL